MNSGDGVPTRVVQPLFGFSAAPLQPVCDLEIYSLAPARLAAVEPLLARHRGPLALVSLRGTKDLVLESTGRPMPLVHVQFDGKTDEGERLAALPPESTCMFCVPGQDALSRALREHGLAPSAGAAIVAHGLEHVDWRFVVTSEI